MLDQMKETKSGSTDSNATETNAQPNLQLVEIQKQMQKLMADHATSTAVLSDPDVQALLRLKAAGESVVVGKKSELEPEVDPLDEFLKTVSSPTEREDLSQAALIENLGKALPNMIAQGVQSAVGPIQKELESLKREREIEIENASISKTQSEIAAAIAKHTDFESYKDDMVTLNEKGLSVEDLYLLAKVKKHGFPAEKPESERPFNVLNTRSSSTRTTEPRRGRQGFAEMINDVYKRR